MTKAAEVGSTANRYEILAKLATGGMAEIFLARGASGAGVERHVVLKRILRHRASDVHFVRMFLDEARLAAQLQHPNVAQVYDIGRLGDSYFFTMEYVHGETVRALLHRAHALKKATPIGATLTIAAGAAAGLHHAHDRVGIDGRPLGIVHRDVSPSNLMVSYEGNVKVVDFGVAKAADKISETRSGTVKGKIAYLSPEQCRGANVDRRSDLFALGIVMWEMLTTERLFRRGSDFEAMTAIVTEDIPPPSMRRPDVPPAVDAIVMRLLAKQPDARFQNAADVVDAIEEAAIASGHMVSTSALGRVLRELFGQRPEPWVEMEMAAPEGVTVTSEPIPAELAIPPAASLDLELNSLPDLSGHRARPSEPPSSSRASLPVFQQPTRMQPTVVPVEALRTPEPELRPRSPTGSGERGMQPLAAQPSVARTSSPGLPHSLVVQPQNVPQVMPVATPMSRPSPSAPIPYPTIARPDDELPGEPRRRLPLIIGILAPAAVIGIVLGVWLSSPSKSVVAIDAAVARVEIDAPPAVAVVSIDAAPPIDADIPIDAAVAHVAIDAAVVAPPVDAAPTIQEHYAAGHYSDALAACAADKVTAETAPACTLAACKLRKESDARHYLALVPAARRERIVSACPVLEPPVRQPPPQPRHVDAGVSVDCKVDPLACQH